MNAFLKTLSTCVLCIELVPAVMAAPPLPSYTITDLGAFWPTDINDRGEIAGEIPEDNGTPAIWYEGKVTVISDDKRLNITSINNRGESTLLLLTAGKAFAYRHGALVDLPGPGPVHRCGASFEPPLDELQAWDINDRGEVLGQSVAAPLLWQNGIFSTLLQFGEPTIKGLNNFGDTLLNRYSVVEDDWGFVFCEGPELVLIQDGISRTVCDGRVPYCRGIGVNNAREVIGQIMENNRPDGSVFLWKDGVREIVAEAGFLVYGFNDQGDIVGAQRVAEYRITGAIYRRSTSSVDTLESLLPADSGWEISGSWTAISNSGRIVGVGKHDGVKSGFLMTPVSPPPVITDWFSGSIHRTDLQLVELDQYTVPGSVECRRPGVQKILVNFDQPIVLNAPVQLTAWNSRSSERRITPQSTKVVDKGLLLEFDTQPLSSGFCYKIDLKDSVRNASGLSLVGDTDLQFGVLTGDVTQDGKVDSSDVALVQSEVGKPLTAANARLDIDHSGIISARDTLIVKSFVGNTLDCAPAGPPLVPSPFATPTAGALD